MSESTKNKIYLKSIAKDLSAWYDQNKRDLPWRNTQDPYFIWLSEIILQQTRVDQGMSYYNKFVEHYPTVKHFANAPLDNILNDWQGLGYYSRARNMHAAANDVIENYGGKFPETAAQLIKLKGVGSYTAAAIASFAFKEQIGVVDGNVFRVIARLFDLGFDISDQKNKRHFEHIMDDLVPHEVPGKINQAVMEFGAMYCKPSNPDCLNCIFQDSCLSFANKTVSERPVKLKKIKKKNRYLHYFIDTANDKIPLLKRQGKDIWEGLYELPMVELSDKGALPEADDARLIIEKKHILTHQNLNVTFWDTAYIPDLTEERKDQVQWYSKEEVEQLGKPILIDKFLKEYIF